MNETVSMLKEKLSELALKLNIVLSSRVDLIKALLLCLVFSPLDRYDADRYCQMAAALHAANIVFGTQFPENDFRDVWHELSECFQLLYAQVGRRPRRFFAIFYEQVVADWDGFQNQLKQILPNENFSINALAVIYYFSCLEESYRKQRFPKTPYEFYLDNKLFPNSWFSYELTEDVFTALWDSMFYFQLDRTPVRISKDLKSIIAEYDKHHIPHSKILGDYAVVLNAGKNLPVINQWQSIKRKLGQSQEYGIAVDEGLFDIFATKMKQYVPTEVVAALFYSNKKRNDSAFECGVLTKIFHAHVKSGNTVYLINPSPFVLPEIDDLKARGQAESIICIVNGAVLRDLYQRQFPRLQFVAIDDLADSIPQYDVALLTARDWQVTEIGQLLQWADRGNEGAALIACVPRTLVSGKKHADVQKRLFKGYTAKRIVDISRKATNSSPRNKVLVYLEKTASEGNYEIVLQDTELDGKNFRFKNESSKTISYDAFVSGAGILQSSEPSEEFSKRNAAKEIHFSKEIVLCYTTKRRGDKVVGRGYYCQMLSESEKATRHRGKRLTEFVEKGLRCKNEADVTVPMLQKVPYYKEIAPFIIFDIRQQYQDRMGELSLKTVWFCSRPALMKKSGYDDSTVKILFDTNHELANLRIGVASLDDYISSMASATNETEVSDLQLWKQLNRILNCAKEEGYIAYNPVREYLGVLEHQATKEQQDVRNALVKKHFTIEEERKILQFVGQNKETRVCGKKVFRKLYVVESLWLLGPIRLYTGITVREACALTWGDFLENKEIDLCQFAITKIVEDDGTVTSRVGSPEKVFRKIPVVSELAIMLKQRKKYLLEERGILAKDLASMPVILENEKRKKEFCRPPVARQTCREIVSSIGIAPNIIQIPDDRQGSIAVDLNKYYGDIFRSNFKYHANHTAYLRRGEINYILAIEPPDTFSKHYCDYPNDLVQLGIAKELHRWAEQHIPVQAGDLFLYEAFESEETCHVHERRSKSGIIKLEETIEIVPDGNEKYIDLTATSRHGITGDINFFKRG